MTRIFLARQEEQKKFRDVLRSLRPHPVARFFRKNFPTVAKLLPAKDAVSLSPHIFLLYGEGGMGKTTLGRRFCELAREEFLDCFWVLRLDWEEAKHESPALNVRHEKIAPKSLLEAIYLAVSRGREGDFEQYRQVGKTLKQIEDKVDKELQARQGEGAEYAPILKKGLSWTLGVLRQLPQVETLVGAGDGKMEEAIAEGAVQALVGLMKKRLTLEERRILATPHRQLAEALGKGLRAMSTQKPLVLVLDTYEIVDRLECDRVLRMVIKAAGQRVVWTIAGRANLADSYRLSQDYFRGYRDDFSENLYVYPMSEFSQEQVGEYFAHPEINVPLRAAEAEAVKRFSLGIPFVVQEIAAIRRQGIELAKILSAPSDEIRNESPYEKVIRVTSDRFLRYCFDENDKKAVSAMAMMRRPDNDLLRAMLDVPDLEPVMRSLKTRHSFVLLEGQGIRLHDKLESFLQDHLRAGLVGQSPMVRELSDRAVAYLEPRLQEWMKEFTDTAEYFESDRIANALLDLVQHKFWQDQEIGWRYAVPLFVESWQYDQTWQQQLLGIIEAFQGRFDRDGKKRLRVFAKDLRYSSFDVDSRAELLEELDKLAKRGWLDGDRKNERMAILSLQRGRLLYQREQYLDAYRVYLETENLLPITSLALRKKLANEYGRIGWELSLANETPISSIEGEDAFSRATKLNKEDGYSLVGLGVAQCGQSRYDEALKNIKAGILLEGEKSYSLNLLGNVYQAQGEYKLAIASYQQAINLDPKFAASHNNLGNIYQTQGEYELAIASYQQAINFDPKFAYPHNNLGVVYEAQGGYELAIISYQQAIRIDPKFAYPHNSLGFVYKAQGEYELAIASYQQAISLDPRNADFHNNLGVVYEAQGEYELAIASYQQAINLDPKDAYPKFNLGILIGRQGNQAEAITLWQQGLELLNENSQYDRLVRALSEVGIGEIERGINSLREILETEKLPIEDISGVLKDAELMAQFPTKLEGIDTIVEMLQQAIQKVQ